MNTMTALATIEKLKPATFPLVTYTGEFIAVLGTGWHSVMMTQTVKSGSTVSVRFTTRTLN